MTHEERMKEWRERNQGGDCGRVANEVLEYLEKLEELRHATRLPLPLGCLLESCANGGGRFGYDVTAKEAGDVVAWIMMAIGAVNSVPSSRGVRFYSKNGGADAVIETDGGRTLFDTSTMPTAEHVGKATTADPADFTHTGMHPNSPTRPGPAWPPTREVMFSGVALAMQEAYARVDPPSAPDLLETAEQNAHGGMPCKAVVDLVAYLRRGSCGPHSGKLPSERLLEIVMARAKRDGIDFKWMPEWLQVTGEVLDERLGRAP